MIDTMVTILLIAIPVLLLIKTVQEELVFSANDCISACHFCDIYRLGKRLIDSSLWLDCICCDQKN